MERLAPRATPVTAPETRDGRVKVIADALARYGIYPRRFSQAVGHGETITYAHVATADVPRGCAVVAEALGWENTVVTDLPGVVAVTTAWPADGR